MHDKHGPLVSIGKHLGMFVDQVRVRARYAISDQPMSAEDGGFAADPPTGSGSTSQLIMRTYPDARLRADPRGRDGGVREELAAGVIRPRTH
jgi:hypothetical protein